MSPVLRNVLAFIVGIVVGGIVNLGLITIGMSVIPLPEGMDVSTMESLRANMRLLGPVNFLFPLLGHALGAFTGAFLVTKIAASHHMKLAIGVGLFFLMGGIAMILNCGGPLWFILTDLILAYIPMAYFGGYLGQLKKKLNQNSSILELPRR